MQIRIILILLTAALMTGCAAPARLSSLQNGASVTVRTGKDVTTPRTESFSVTSFGNYEFKAERTGFDPLYGVLPLKFNGGYLTLDILFFTPAMFFNLREVYSNYEFDLAKKLIKYRQAETDGWSIYEPSEAETKRAKEFFDQNGHP